mmetsp:Transcript_66771/g.169271  ORF Transcript_66771/g.169271 Transcript_66771/m.169271 type:complete len:86 (+) Transcript_66771:325-582(+)
MLGLAGTAAIAAGELIGLAAELPPVLGHVGAAEAATPWGVACAMDGEAAEEGMSPGQVATGAAGASECAGQSPIVGHAMAVAAAG